MSKTEVKVEGLSDERKALLEKLMALEEKKGAAKEAELVIPTIEPDPAHRYDPFPLTDIQQAQWFGRTALFELGSAAHVYAEFDSVGLDIPRLAAAWRRLVDENDMLRVVFAKDLTQRFLEKVPPYEMQVLDLRGKSKKDVEAKLAAIRDELSHQTLGLEKWPIFDVRATLMDGEKVRVHISFDLITADAWSIRVMLDEWTKMYNDESYRRPHPELSFRDYVLALESLEDTELFKRDIEYWREYLKTLPLPPDIPMVKAPVAGESIPSHHWEMKIAPKVWESLQARASKAGLTPSGLCMSAWAEVIALWSKSPRFAMNVTVFNRMPVHSQVNDIMIGEFNSFVLLGVDFTRPQSFEERAKGLQMQLWQHLEHRSVTGVRLMRELARARGTTSGGALMPLVFTSTLAHHESGGYTPTLFPGEQVYEVSQTPQVWMENHIWEDHGALVINCDVRSDLFPPDLFDELFRAYEQFLTELSSGEEGWQRTPRQHLVPEAHQRLAASLNATEGKTSNELLHTLFVRQAAERPTATAVIADDRTLSYAELDRLSNQVASWLQGNGAEPNQLVAVVMGKGWQQIVAVLGVLKSGAAYLPLDPESPQDRLFYLYENADVKLALTSEAHLQRLEWPKSVKAVAVEGAEIARQKDTAGPLVQGPDDIAYVIYTSGSTGKPKGVVIHHRGAVNTLLDINARFAVSPTDRVLAVSALSFDLSVYDVFGTLAAGAALVMPRDSGTPDPHYWLSLAQKHAVSIWNSVPALAGMVVEQAEARAESFGKAMRLFLLSGDWIPVTLPDRLRELAPTAQVVSLGGATEASIWSIFFPIGAVDPGWKSIPYGRPLTNQRFYVLNEQLETRPLWVPGHLYIGGVGLARGYWGDEEKTNASFITHPKTGERLYRTGDLGRYLPDGVIEFLGREDQQVKIRGYRIELGEIEEVLNQHPSVRNSVVAAWGDTSENRRLVAYVVPEEGAEVVSEQLTAHLKLFLPDYMVPQSYLNIPALPISANGKVDRKALPAPDQVDREAARVYVAPRNPTEEKLAEMWQHVLDVEQVGVNDDFFELGGNSLLANQLLFRIHDAFQVELPLSRLFEMTTVAKLAVAIEEQILEQMERMTEEETVRLLNAE
ncbi:MAG: amino acid adenylation domain-containing protein [Thermoanaerobaculia bacterium]